MKNKITDLFKKVFQSKNFKNIIYVFGFILGMAIIFQAGVSVGIHKASFGRDWKEGYSRNFGPIELRPMFGGVDMMENLPNAHGSIGKIIKIELPSVVVEDADKTEKVILIKDDTIIREMRDSIDKNNLKINDFVVVIGSPNQAGQIEAKLIRVLPEPAADGFTDNQIQPTGPNTPLPQTGSNITKPIKNPITNK